MINDKMMLLIVQNTDPQQASCSLAANLFCCTNPFAGNAKPKLKSDNE
jgi:hypothetical protein